MSPQRIPAPSHRVAEASEWQRQRPQTVEQRTERQAAEAAREKRELASVARAAKSAQKSSSRSGLPAAFLVEPPTSFRPGEGTRAPTPPTSVSAQSDPTRRGGGPTVELWPPGKWQHVDEGGAVLSAPEYQAVQHLLAVALPKLEEQS
jgi:hypothetical protein